jgi:hypothetical protein
VAECGDAKLLQVFFRQARKDRVVYLVLTEGRLVAFETEPPQPITDAAKRTSATAPIAAVIADIEFVGEVPKSDKVRCSKMPLFDHRLGAAPYGCLAGPICGARTGFAMP